jgi:hypothetical protein
LSARTKAQEHWSDPDAEPELLDLIKESGSLPELNEGTLAALLSRICDVAKIPDGPLMWRAGVLEERIRLLEARIRGLTRRRGGGR